MSTVTEIKAALGRLTPTEYYEITDWIVQHAPAETPERIIEIQRKLDEAERGTFRRVSPEEQIKKLVASLE